MRLTHLIAAAAGLSMIAAPAFSASNAPKPNPAAKLSLTNGEDVRAGAPMKRSSKARASTLLLVGLGAAAVVTAAIALGNNDSQPASN